MARAVAPSAPCRPAPPSGDRLAYASGEGRHLGRFELLRELGRGAQATVWLARDPRLQREVALKLLDPEAESLDEWLHEARAVSCLSHPNVVPVFEADDAGGQPYLVFEYVEGPTLAQARRQRGAWPAREAVALMLGVLDALAAAHAQGIVHRDLKPSNVLLGSDGRARVMDFGIAARVHPAGRGRSPADSVGGSDGLIVGTPGYMSPEAARAEAPAPCMDVFAAGVILAEMLAGAPLIRATTAADALHIVQTQDLSLPASTAADDTLRGIVQRALARDSAARYDGARALHAALAAWLDPQATPVPTSAAISHGTLEFLLRRMRHKTDFPALSSSVVRIQRVASSETESLASLTAEILKDVALTNKLLRMVNSVRFAQAAGGGVGTVSRAVALVGFAGIRNMALAVVLLEHMGDKGHAALMAEEFGRALMAGMLASELSAEPREAEEVFLGSMFQNLGRLLTEYYFPEEALLIRQRLPANATASMAEREAAAHQVLGLGLDDLGAGVAQAWGLPDALSRAMRPPEGDVPLRAAPNGIERLRWLGRSANALTDAMLSSDGPAQVQALAAAAEAHAAVLGTPARQIVVAAEGARVRWVQMSQALGLPLGGAVQTRRLLHPAGESVPSPGRAAAVAVVAPSSTSADRTLVQPQGAGPAAAVLSAPTAPSNPLGGTAATATATATARTLAEGLAACDPARGGRGLALNERLNLVLEALHRGLNARCVVLCLRDARSGQLAGRVGLGSTGAAMSAAFRVDTGDGPGADLFGALCARGADTLIGDTRGAAVAARLPSWYRGKLQASSFLLLPMMLKRQPIGLIYTDRDDAGPIVLTEPEMQLVRLLRDTAVAAFTRPAA